LAQEPSVVKAADALGMNPDTLRSHRRRYRPIYDADLAEAKAKLANPGQVVLEKPVPRGQQTFPT
jgi:hypothetical protein